MHQRSINHGITARAVSAVAFLAATMAFASVAAAANHAPTISGTPATKARVGLAYSFTPKASDADGNTLKFSISNRPAWAKFRSSTGALTGTPGPGTEGLYPNIRIKVSDGNASARLPTFSIEVQQSSMGSATLSWQGPTARTDGTALTNLDGYHIRYGTAAGSYPNLVDITNEGLTTAIVSNLPPATYYFVISAYDTSGAESAFVGPAFKTVN